MASWAWGIPTPACCCTKLPLFLFDPFSPFFTSSEMKLWRQRDTILAAEFIYLRHSACKCAEGLRFAVCVVLHKGDQQFVDSSSKDQWEQTFLSFLSDFLRVNNRYWPYGITVAHCKLCMKFSFPLCCGQVLTVPFAVRIVKGLAEFSETQPRQPNSQKKPHSFSVKTPTFYIS